MTVEKEDNVTPVKSSSTRGGTSSLQFLSLQSLPRNLLFMPFMSLSVSCLLFPVGVKKNKTRKIMMMKSRDRREMHANTRMRRREKEEKKKARREKGFRSKGCCLFTVFFMFFLILHQSIFILDSWGPPSSSSSYYVSSSYRLDSYAASCSDDCDGNTLTERDRGHEQRTRLSCVSL